VQLAKVYPKGGRQQQREISHQLRASERDKQTVGENHFSLQKGELPFVQQKK